MKARIVFAAAVTAALALASAAGAQQTVVVGSDPHTGGPTPSDQQAMADIQARLAELRNRTHR